MPAKKSKPLKLPRAIFSIFTIILSDVTITQLRLRSKTLHLLFYYPTGLYDIMSTNAFGKYSNAFGSPCDDDAELYDMGKGVIAEGKTSTCLSKNDKPYLFWNTAAPGQQIIAKSILDQLESSQSVLNIQSSDKIIRDESVDEIRDLAKHLQL